MQFKCIDKHSHIRTHITPFQVKFETQQRELLLDLLDRKRVIEEEEGASAFCTLGDEERPDGSGERERNSEQRDDLDGNAGLDELVRLYGLGGERDLEGEQEHGHALYGLELEQVENVLVRLA